VTIAIVKQLGKFARSLLYLFNDEALYERRIGKYLLLIYGECQKNQRQAVTLSAERFPNKHQNTDFSIVYLLDLFNIVHYMLQHVHGTYRNKQKQQLIQ